MLGVLVVFVIIISALTGGGGQTPSASGSGGATPPTGSHPTTPPATHPTTAAPKKTHSTTTAVPACTTDQVTVAVSTSQVHYQSGVDPHFVLTVTNTAGHACRVDVGTAARSFVVYSGQDRIWSSADCVTTTHNVATLKAKEKVAYAATWHRVRSSTSCSSGSPAAAKPGFYRVSGHLGSLTTREAVFELS